MEKQQSTESGITTEQAINEVLKAERDAQQQVTQCDKEAELILEQARQTARRIGERNNNRITRIHQRCSRIITDEIARMQAESEQLKQDKHVDQFDTTTMSEVLEQIAIAMTTTQKERD